VISDSVSGGRVIPGFARNMMLFSGMTKQALGFDIREMRMYLMILSLNNIDTLHAVQNFLYIMNIHIIQDKEYGQHCQMSGMFTDRTVEL
jgi:hypothetical protein